jgi:hypothetical protein
MYVWENLHTHLVSEVCELCGSEGNVPFFFFLRLGEALAALESALRPGWL